MKNFKALKYWLPLITAVTFVLGMWFGSFIDRKESMTPGEQKLHELFDLVSDRYVDTINLDSLIERSIPSIISNLDPHSLYIPASQLEAAKEELEGSFGGVGIHFQVYNDTVNVVEVVPGGPSDKAGVAVGDRIIEVDGKPFIFTENNSETKIRETLRGPRGSQVRITVKRPGEPEPLKFNIIRGDIPMNSVDASYMLDDSTGYVKVSRFSRNTYAEFVKALIDRQNEGAEDFVIDLRGNTGGFMETAILMVNEFLPRAQKIVATRGRDQEEEIVLSDGTGVFTDSRLVILIDEMSASSSEIFSGAIQDNDRGLLIGRRSFGKGLVQSQIDMNDGSELRLTVQRYYTPSGRSIQKEYKPGQNDSYEYEIFDRYKNGELLNEDSIKLHKELMFKTGTGRPVYGGGGIVPDIFVPNDTSGVTNYYYDIVNKGLLSKFAYEYCDLNRAELSKAENLDELLSILPSYDILLNSFVRYASNNGVPARWYYIKHSAPLIVNQLKAIIARNVLGISSYYEVMNSMDTNVSKALEQLKAGNADFPIRELTTKKK